jgi:hypothetical protein
MYKFAGMWKLDKYESFDSVSGKWHDTPGRVGYSGYILYDGKGHMGVQLLPPEFKDVFNNKNIDTSDVQELKKDLRLYSASFEYFANCDIKKETNSIEHHIVSSNHPEDWGTTVKRNFVFIFYTLILTANELIGGRKTRLRWIRL